MAKIKTQYFPHDYNARNDPKLRELFAEHGIEAVGAYWCIVEMLYEQNGYLPLKYKSIAFELHIDTIVIQNIVLNFNLFENNGEVFWSNSVLARLNERKNISDARRGAVSNRWNSEKKIQMQYKSNTNVIQNDTNINKKEKENNNIVNSIPVGIEPIESPTDQIPYSKILKLWNDTCLSFPKLAKITEPRKNKLRIRLQEMGGKDLDKAIGVLAEVFALTEESNFLKGDNKRGWKANFDWVIENPKNWVKIYEGNYKNQTSNETTTSNNGLEKTAAAIDLAFAMLNSDNQ